MISEKLTQLLMGKKRTNSKRMTEVIAGMLFIVGMVAGILSVVPVIDGAEYLVKAYLNESQVLRGAFFQLLMLVPYVGIPILLYPILSKYKKGMAMGSVSFGIIAGVFIILGVIMLLLLLALSRQYSQLGSLDLIYFKNLGEILRWGRDLVNHVAMTLAFCMSLLFINLIFYKTKLIPRWLSAWGAIGAILSILASLLFMNFLIALDGVYMVLNVPIAIQEMVLAIWLIFKGFSTVSYDFKAKE